MGLQKLIIYDNSLRNLKGLENLINLQELHLSDNKLVNIKGLKNLINLRALILCNNQLDLSDLYDLERCAF